MNKKLFFSFLIFIFSTVLYGVTYKSISPKGKYEMDDGSSVIEIDCNISDASVYVNRNYKGKTPCVIKTLNPGYYEISVEKEGYETGYYRVMVKKGYRYYYKVELKKEMGFVNLLNEIEDILVAVDGIKVEGPNFSFEVGNHTLKVRKFGRNDFSASITINPNETTKVHVELPKAKFKITDLKVSKKVINPAYTGGLGTSEISFFVTSDGTAKLYIQDEYGFTVWEKDYDSFSTWENSVYWSGTATDGSVLPDGDYTVNIAYDDVVLSKEITISSGYSYPLQSFTNGGGGVGDVPYAMQNKGRQIMPFIYVNPIFSVNDSFGYNSFEFGLGALFDFAKHFEFGLNSSALFGAEDSPDSNSDAPYRVLFNTKFSWDFDAGESLLGLSLYARYGFSGMKYYAEAFGDNGTGLGAGLALGWEKRRCYTGISSEYIWGAQTGKIASEYGVLKTGLCFTFSPYINRKLSFWGAINSQIGEEFKYLSCINTGIEYSILPDGTALLISFKAAGIINPGATSYVSGIFTLSYLF